MGIKGSELVAAALAAQGVRDFFHLVGGPITGTIQCTMEHGIRGVDVRDERAGVFAAIAYSRVSRRPGLVMTCSGPGTTNTVTGLAHAHADGAPVVVLGGSAAQYQRGTGAFQETDQVALMRPITKWSHQVTDPDGLPAAVARAFHVATSGTPGPVYLDLPADVLFGEGAGDASPEQPRPALRSAGDPSGIAAAVDLLEGASRPIVIGGSGVLWAQAWGEFCDFIDHTGIPFYTTPMARGLIREDHPLSFQAARSKAFSEADYVLIVGTRDNYVLNFLQPPVMSREAAIVELNISPDDLGRNRVADVALLADAKLGLAQLSAEIRARDRPSDFGAWVQRLGEVEVAARERSRPAAESDEVPVHPVRLAACVDAVAPQDAIRVLDGRDMLAFGRRQMLAYLPGGLLSPGVYGTMGVGVPFGIGAKVASPSAPVVVLTGDGAFGYHAMEIDTAVRHGLGVVFVIGNNGGWTARRERPGFALAYSDYQRLADVFGCWGEKVTDPAELESAMGRAVDYAATESKPAVLNVVMASVSSDGRGFTNYSRGGGGNYDDV